MKNNLTEMVFLLDRSGSMSGLEGDTVGGYNSLIEKQKAMQGKAIVTTLLFDDRCETLHFRKDIKDILPITQTEYFVRGSTALLDAMGGAIDKIGLALAETAEEERPSKVMFVVITDGMENASREYRLQRVKDMIEHQKSKYSWEFMFLGANIDAVSTAKSYGISPDRAVTYTADSQGTAVSYRAVTNALCKMRSGEGLSSDWKEEVEADTAAREYENSRSGGRGRAILTTVHDSSNQESGDNSKISPRLFGARLAKTSFLKEDDNSI